MSSEVEPKTVAPRASSVTAHRTEEDDEHMSESDEDTDLNPEQMRERYLKMKTELHRRRPDLTEALAPTKRKGKVRQNPQPPQTDASTSMLLRRLRTLESDILFDRDRADAQWRERRVELVKADAMRKHLSSNGSEQHPPGINEVNTDLGLDATEATEDADSMNLGDFFASLPAEQTDADTGIKSMAVTSEEGIAITVRDFGKWSGINPRRVLEESCRARDTAVSIQFSLISSASFSNRHRIKIAWSKPQELSDETNIPGTVLTESNERTVSIEMRSVSTPDKAQSEAFISTAAMFLIFASSPKEEKAYMRLPAVWRDLWSEFSGLREERLNALDREEVRGIRRILEQRPDEEKHEGFKIETKGSKGQEQRSESNEDSTSNAVHPIDHGALRALWQRISTTPFYQRMLSTRQKLPVWQFKEELLASIEKNQAVIVCGETGCGKSTQVPAFILERELFRGRNCKIYCTEPRRISAITLARRVSEELGERKSDVGTSRSLIGYAIRLENQTSANTRLVYATTGILMRMLENPEAFAEITHIVLDEVHERNIDSDFLLIILRRLMVTKPTLKLVLMSATVDATRFSNYLHGAPILNVPGRTFPVETKFLEDAVEDISAVINLQDLSRRQTADVEIDDEESAERENVSSTKDLQGYSTQTRKFIAQFNEYKIDYALIVKLLEVIASADKYRQYSKAILVFLPGLAEIRRINNILVEHPVFAHKWKIFPLHSTIATEAQEAAFLIPPTGFRKIVLATNIAETGITIPDITCVLDSGKHREMR